MGQITFKRSVLLAANTICVCWLDVWKYGNNWGGKPQRNCVFLSVGGFTSFSHHSSHLLVKPMLWRGTGHCTCSAEGSLMEEDFSTFASLYKLYLLLLNIFLKGLNRKGIMQSYASHCLFLNSFTLHLFSKASIHWGHGHFLGSQEQAAIASDSK